MTAYELQDDLISELKAIFKGFQLKTPLLTTENQSTYSEPNIFSQNLPVREDDNEEDDPYPYVIVKVDSASIARNKSLIKTRLMIGVFDDAPGNNGHKDILNIIQKIYDRFSRSPILAGKYVMKDDIENPLVWVIHEEDLYPYYFGAIDIVWETATIGRESKFI